MLPGRIYTFDDIAAMIRRRAWIIVLPVLLAAAATAVVLQRLPERYRSDTLILVVPQRVPESYVQATVTMRIEDRLQSISQQLLSRTRLERTILDLDLYPRERRFSAMEDVVERMRTDIQVQVVKGDAFRVSYVAESPVLAQRVTERLSSMFIEENLRNREGLAEATNEFLDTQLADARRRLVEQEEQLAQYRVQHAGQLPSQLQSNLQATQNLQVQAQGLVDSANRDRDRRLVLERTLIELESLPDDATPPLPATGGSDDQSPVAQLEALRQSVAAMEVRLKPQHPDMVRARLLIRELEERIAVEAKPEGMAAGPSATQRRRIEALHAEIETLDRQIAEKDRRQRMLFAQIGGYDARIAAVPARESELASLTRDYDTLQKVYTDLLSKREQSKVAANLERRQIGEQFTVLDPARLPETPFSPNRPLLLLVGLAIGLAVGSGLAGWLEFRNTSLRSAADVSATLALPVLAQVPVRPRRAPAVASDPGDAYRRLAVELHQLGQSRPLASVMIASAVPSEGKSVTAANLAVALSTTYRKRVLLVDCDLRQPTLHRLFGVDVTPGVSDGVLADGPPRVRPRKLSDTLWLLTAGREDSNPLTTLTSPRLKELLADLARHVDVVIVDGPPMVLCPDGHVLASLTDGVVVVVGAGKTPLAAIESTVKTLGHERIVGVVLNRAALPRAYYQYQRLARKRGVLQRCSRFFCRA